MYGRPLQGTLRRLSGALLACTLALLIPQALHAWSADKTPASPVPSNRWGGLEPRAILGDQTAFDFHNDPGINDPFWFAVDVENGWLFAITGRGMQTYDARTNPGAPALVGYGYAANPQRGEWCPPDGSAQSVGLMPCWNHSDEDWFLRDLDAPPGVDNVVAVAGREQGFSAWNTSNKATLSVHYQDEGTSSQAVYSTTIGGTHYAFSLNNSGVTLYDLSAARGFTGCRRVSGNCPSVFKGQLPGVGGGSHIDGVGNFIIIGRNFLGFEIWDVSTPTSPVRVMTGAGQHTTGVGMWKSGSSHFAAHVGFAGKLFVYDVSCITSGLCVAPLPMAQVPVPGGSAPLLNLTSSSSNGTPYLQVGGDDTFSCKPQREYLFKMTNPAQPEDITPQGHGDGYWGWYYEGCSTGFNWVSPMMGKFSGNHYYRSAYSLLDVHELAGAQPPNANFSWSPGEIYPGTVVSFSDASTGTPNAWSWTFGGGAPGTSSAKDPSGISFTSPGEKNVTLQAFNSNGDDTESKTLTVIDPLPAVASVGVSPGSPFVCQPLTLTANGATGQPVLGFAWDVKSDATTTTVQTGNGSPFTWNIPSGLTPGSYTATVTASNGAGSASKSATFTVSGLATLPGDGFALTADPFVAGTVQFHVNVPGATEWNWDFEGDGFNEADWTNNPVTGPNPVHSYTTTGIRQVKVKVRNCVNTGGATSAALEVNITQITPLKAIFSLLGGAQCIPGTDPLQCTANANTTLTFADASTGADFWDYDWDGNGTFEDAGNTAAKTEHLYATASSGFFRPKLRVRRGASEENVFDLPQSLKIDPSGPVQQPSITIGGPSSGQPNTDLTFTAVAQNCTPNPTGWNWNAGGGTLTGSGNSVKIKWSSTGTKNISVTNSDCQGATGAKSVGIGSNPPPPPPPPPPGQLEAKFTFAPAAPKSGELVTFNGSTSTGSPTGYTWSFGDGSALVSGASATATHTYANAGLYLVTLSVVNTNKACPPAPFCESTATKQLVVVPSTPPPAASFTTSAPCTQEFSLVTCNAAAGEPVTFTDTSTGGAVATRTWDFGDGQTATGAVESHAFAEAGTYIVSLTVGNAGGATNTTRTFLVAEAAVANSIVLPWIAQTRGVLDQSSDLYIHNPGDAALAAVVTFRRRGTPESNPPQEPLTIPPHATLFYADVINDLFDKENIAGFITVDPEGNGPAPIITSFNTTFLDGSQFGQAITGAVVESQQETTLDAVRHLIGLNATTDRLAYLGVSNPHDAPATYRLAFFDKLGKKVSESEDIVLARFGQQQFQPKQLETQFGIADLDDYRVEVRSVAGGRLFPYGANLRLASSDPSFVAGGKADQKTVHLPGVFGTAGLNGSKWQTDVVLANSSDQVALVEVFFQSVGVDTPREDVVRLTLQPRETKRVENVLQTWWGLSNAVGALTFTSDSPNGVFPTIAGEIYDNANPARRFGQSMGARSLAEAAKAGQSQHLIGLRQDADYRSTVSLFNPSTEHAVFDVIYRRLDGTPLPALTDVQLGPGRSRQLNPAHHPLPAGGVADGFSVEIKVKAGRLLVGGQVVNNRSNDPAFIDGATR